MIHERRFETFIGELPYYWPLMNTPKGDVSVYLRPQHGHTPTVEISFLVALHRGAGRAAMEMIIAAADRHDVTLVLNAVPQKKVVAGKCLTRPQLRKFYAGFGFTQDRRFPAMRRTPQKGSL